MNMANADTQSNQDEFSNAEAPTVYVQPENDSWRQARALATDIAYNVWDLYDLARDQLCLTQIRDDLDVLSSLALALKHRIDLLSNPVEVRHDK